MRQFIAGLCWTQVGVWALLITNRLLPNTRSMTESEGRWLLAYGAWTALVFIGQGIRIWGGDRGLKFGIEQEGRPDGDTIPQPVQAQKVNTGGNQT